MRLVPLTSSQLASVGYNPHTEIMVAQFHKGGYYRYNGVPEGVFVSVVIGESQGRAFDQFVKKAGYPFQTITAEDVALL